MAKWMVNGHEVGGTINTASSVACTDKDGQLSNVQAEFEAVREELKECFQSVSDGKAWLASAITDKGVTTAQDATFETMIANVRNIKDVANNTGATAVAAMITEGFTAWVNGKLITGTRPAPVTAKTGSLNTGEFFNEWTYTISFGVTFDKIPTFTCVTSEPKYVYVEVKSVTVSSAIVRVYLYGATGYRSTILSWTAQA